LPSDSSFTDKTLNDLEGWNVIGASSTNYFTHCAGKVVGGLNSFGKKTSIAKSFKVSPHY